MQNRSLWIMLPRMDSNPPSPRTVQHAAPRGKIAGAGRTGVEIILCLTPIRKLAVLQYCPEPEGSMYVWLDIVGREEKRIKRLQPLQRIALAVACIDHAFSVMDEYLAAYVPKQSLGMAKQAIEALWEFLAASK